MPHRSEDERIKSLLRRTSLDGMSRIAKVRALLDRYRGRNTRPGDGEFVSDDDKLLYTALDLLTTELEEVKKLTHYHHGEMQDV